MSCSSGRYKQIQSCWRTLHLFIIVQSIISSSKSPYFHNIYHHPKNIWVRFYETAANTSGRCMLFCFFFSTRDHRQLFPAIFTREYIIIIYICSLFPPCLRTFLICGNHTPLSTWIPCWSFLRDLFKLFVHTDPLVDYFVQTYYIIIS